MFHYRWHPEEDAKNAAKLLPILQEGVSISSDQHDIYSDYIYDRQVGRLGVVGSNKVTADLIEQSYIRTLRALDNHLERYSFIFGSRPSASDFALYGQLSQLIGFDPTPRRIAHEIAPRVIGWVSSLEDRSGLEDKENNLKLSDLPQTIHDLFQEMSTSYIPTLIANKQAIEKGKNEWEIDLDNGKWKQKSFPYQAKCLSLIHI
mgnify:CR=1 FL=1